VSFADRVIRLRGGSRLSDTEKTGDPHAIAAEFVQIGSETEVGTITAPRASALYSDCMRMRVIGVKHKMKLQQWSSFTDRITYGIGNAFHYWVQNDWDVLGGRRIGWWLCRGCEKNKVWGGPPKEKCSKCGAMPGAFVYWEHALKLTNPLPLSGHPDMFARTRDKFLRVVEIKSIVADQWETLRAPLISHQWQIQAYMWGCNQPEAGLPEEIDPEYGYMMLARIKEKLTLFKVGLANYPNQMPPLIPQCERTRWECYKAKTCPGLVECKKLQLAA